MSPLVEYAVCAALVIGALFTLVGSYGLVKLNSPMSRLHAPTKVGTLGVGSILIASVIYRDSYAQKLPSPGEDSTWATKAVPQQESTS